MEAHSALHDVAGRVQQGMRMHPLHFLALEAAFFAAVVVGLFAETFVEAVEFLPTTFMAPKVAPAIKIIIATNRSGLDICSDFPKP